MALQVKWLLLSTKGTRSVGMGNYSLKYNKAA